VLIESGKAAKGPAARWAVVLGLKFVIVAEHYKLSLRLTC
jgi:hypothetical protein